MAEPVSYDELRTDLLAGDPPLLIDVRRRPAFLSATGTITGAIRRDPERVDAWAGELPRAARAVVYCAHGRDVSQLVAAELEERGIGARFLEGGIEAGWCAHGGALHKKPAGASTRWVTRARPKIDRIACPWLISRFIDAEAEFLFVPPAEVMSVAKAREATPYDIPDVAFSHEGGRCSFDAFLAAYHLRDPALDELATIVRGADTGELGLAPQAHGLLAISLGLSRLFSDDHEMLRHGMVVYDALYAWCRSGKDEVHTWNPAAYRV